MIFMWKAWPQDPRYRVSDRGEVRGPSYLWTGRNLRLQSLTEWNYPAVWIGGRMVYVHVMVLETFDKPRPPGLECRHLNGNNRDNRWPENICWGTHGDNMRDRARHGRYYPRKPHHMVPACPD